MPWLKLAAASACLVLCGCTLFPNDFPAFDAGQGEDAGMEDIFFVGDRCASDLQLSESNRDVRMVSFEGLTDSTRSLLTCDATGLDGPDAFIQFTTTAEERWRLVAEPMDDTTDVVLHLSPGCDTGACILSRDFCGAGLPESLTFVAPAEGTYGFGIDTLSTAGPVEVLLQKTVCGDRSRDPGEACDDGNRTDGDGCSRNCLLELSTEMGQSARELEPNNGPTESNVLTLEMGERAGTVTAVGRLGGACDEDFYSITVREGQSLIVTMLDGAEQPCAAGTPEATLTLFEGRTLSLRGTGTLGGAGGQCPEIAAEVPFATNLDAGDYFISVSAPRDTGTIPYSLQVEVVDRM